MQWLFMFLSMRTVQIVETACGRSVAADPEVGDVTVVLRVVGPFEFELKIRAALQPEHRARYA